MNRENVKMVFLEGLALMEKKNSDYAGKIDNISMTGLTGIAVRLIDKVSRAYTLTSQENQVKDESIRDTLIDIMNYANIGVQLLDKTWKEKLVRFEDLDIPDKLMFDLGARMEDKDV